MANQYGNLDNLMMDRGRKDEGCRMLGEALRLFTEIGARGLISQTEDLLKKYGCPDA